MKSLKYLILSLTLLFPIAIFMFIKLFGKNEYRLPVLDVVEIYNPKSVNCPDREVDGAHRIAPFSLLSHTGETFSSENLDGKIVITDFFFTRCPDICISMTSELQRVQEKLKEYSDVQIVSYTVNPEYDTPEVLTKYAQNYGVSLSNWTFLTGDKEQIYELARCSYFIAVKPAETSEFDFIHSDKLVLIDKQKRVRGYYSGTSREDVDRLITEVMLVAQEDSKQQ